MIKKLFYILIFASTCCLTYAQSTFVYSRNGTVKRQKRSVNQNCISYQGQKSVYAEQSYLVDEPKSVSEKKFEKYILSNYPNDFPKTSIIFYVVFQPNLPPCCRQTNIEDSLAMDKKQIDFLTDLVLKYPAFNTIQFNKDEKAKYLVIHMSRYKRSKFSIGFGYK